MTITRKPLHIPLKKATHRNSGASLYCSSSYIIRIFNVHFYKVLYGVFKNFSIIFQKTIDFPRFMW